MKLNNGLYIAGFLFVVVGCYIGIKNDIPTGTKEAVIQRNFEIALPVGSSMENVVSYLDANKIEHDEFDKKNYDVVASIPNVERDVFVRTEVQVFFHFDKHKKLLSFFLKEILTQI